ncbi:type I-E CRISPR-associated protein Cas6/Cse3/CasE [Kitasatospora sp. NPDC001119]
MTTAHLTEIHLNTASRDVQADLRHGGLGFHRRTERLFLPDGYVAPRTSSTGPRPSLGLLWRLDTTRTGLRLLIQSTDPPDLTTLPDHYGTARTTELGPYLDHLTTGQHVHYRLTASPVHWARDKTTGKPLRNRIPCTGPDITHWWTRRAPDLGLDPYTTTTFQLTPVTGVADHNPHMRLPLTRYDGLATITDPTHLRAAILHGIGRSKAFGAGLLTLAPPN